MQFYLFYSILLSILLTFTTGTFAVAEESAEIITTAGPSWERFTNEDGTGLYHEIIREVFAGSQVKHVYVTSVQANSLVGIGRADIKMCETKDIEGLTLSTVPMYENDFFVVFLHDNIHPWQGQQSLLRSKMVWREGYYSAVDFPVPVNFVEVRSGESALQMVIHGRADLYVDDLNLIHQSFAATGVVLDPAKFGVEEVGVRKYFPIFAKTPRGDKLRRHYEQEMKRLYRNGTLNTIYTRWGFSLPRFGFSAPKPVEAEATTRP